MIQSRYKRLTSIGKIKDDKITTTDIEMAFNGNHSNLSADVFNAEIKKAFSEKTEKNLDISSNVVSLQSVKYSSRTERQYGTLLPELNNAYSVLSLYL